MVTQKDIARRLRLSQMTVSRVLNGSPLVGEKTRRRVWREMERRGYRPNVSARNLVSQCRGAVAVVIPEPQSMYSFYFLPALEGISEVVNARGQNLLFVAIAGARDCAEKLPDAANRADAFIVFNFSEMRPYLGAILSVLREQGKRVITIQSYRGRAQAPYITIDNVLGGALATRHLAELGHRRIACVGLEYDSAETRARLKGYRTACAEAGLALDAGWVIPRFDRGRSGELRRLFAGTGAERPTAVFAMSDRVARVVMFECARAGCRVPEDVSVVGFNDDAPFVTMMHPHLTTVRQPLRELGRTAAERVLALGNGDGAAGENVILAPQLVERESTSRIG
ncbi:MAG: LacI family DNA-binding transcriptional regulator [Kiritimatiellae bacterium]|nr:LacI family DNA-binding transcriptional regulator [Kiritimatiellia bacterium]